MNLEQIFKYNSPPSNFNITRQKIKYERMGGQIPDRFQRLDSLSKDDVIELIKSKKATSKEELLSILFWGIYFEVLARSPKSIRSLIDFIESCDFDKELSNRKKEIINSENPAALFRSFSNEQKIPGLDYAYFTKLFFFYREAHNKSTYPIMDKWLCRAWCAIDGSINKNRIVFDTYFSNTNNSFSGILQRQKPQGYQNYVEFINCLATSQQLEASEVEAKLFGQDLRCSNGNYNPRIEYLNWAVDQRITV